MDYGTEILGWNGNVMLKDTIQEIETLRRRILVSILTLTLSIKLL